MTIDALRANPWDREGQTLLHALGNGVDLDSLITALTGLDPEDERFSWHDGRTLKRMIATSAKALQQHSTKIQFIALSVGLLGVPLSAVGSVYNLTENDVRKVYAGLSARPKGFTPVSNDWDSNGWVPSSAAMFDEQVRVAYARLSLLALRASSVEQSHPQPDWLRYIETGSAGSIAQARSAPVIELRKTAETTWLTDTGEPDSPVVAWAKTRNGPVLVAGDQAIESPILGAGVALSWADAVLFDKSGPLAGVIALDNQRDDEIQLRIWASLWASAAQPMVIIVTHPKESGSMSDFSLDDHLPTLPILAPSEYFPGLLSTVQPQPFLPTQEIWHIRRSLLSAAVRFLRLGRRPPVNAAMGIFSVRTPRLLHSGKVEWKSLDDVKT